MMAEELRAFPEQYGDPFKSGVVVGLASIVGSLIPVMPFFFIPVQTSIWLSLAVCTLALFAVGAVKAKLTVGKWWLAGIELAAIGMTAAIGSYFIGLLLGITI
jgi:predicted membrane protein (TIGR00267 family)